MSHTHFNTESSDESTDMWKARKYVGSASAVAPRSSSPPLSILPPPPYMMNSMAGTYHPEFIFCGACTTCQDTDEKKELDESEKLETYEEERAHLDPDVVVLNTTFRIREPVTNPSHLLVLQSVVTKLPGVSRVVVQTEDPSLVIYHDPSLSTDSVLNALQTTGHSAVVHNAPFNQTTRMASPGDQNTEPIWVRSQLYVRGICCASEVPAVRKIVKPLNGVSKLQINITTKMVHVQHDASIISARDIAQKLSDEGFPSKVERDGQDLVGGKHHALHHGRTVIQVNGTLLEADVSKVQSLLSQLRGVSRVGVTKSDSQIHIDHDVYTVTSEQCKQALDSDFVCRIESTAEQSIGDAATLAFDAIRRSRFVESTIHINGLDSRRIDAVETVLSRNFKETQVRAAYPNAVAGILKVEHDPEQASILDVCGILTAHGFKNAYVAVDGADACLYLPEGGHSKRLSTSDDEPSLLKIHTNVWISGIFWILSMVGYSEGR